jgi:hypothetical protein
MMKLPDHVYVLDHSYTRHFIIKDERYTFTFV